MRKNSHSQSGIFHPRVLLAFALCSAGVLLAMVSLASQSGAPGSSNRQDGDRYTDRLERDMPVPGGEPDALDRMETEWNNRLTYPTGLFNPPWVRLAAAQVHRGHLPIIFEPNVGQSGADVRYLAHHQGSTIYFTSSE